MIFHPSPPHFEQHYLEVEHWKYPKLCRNGDCSASHPQLLIALVPLALNMTHETQ